MKTAGILALLAVAPAPPPAVGLTAVGDLSRAQDPGAAGSLLGARPRLKTQAQDPGDLSQGRSSLGTPGRYLRRLAEQEASGEVCLPALDAQVRKLGFDIDPQLWVDQQMRPGSRLFTVGDSVIGQMHALGKPGFSCSATRPCEGSAPFLVGDNQSWEIELDKTDSRYKDKGWQHLKRFMVRSSQGTISQVEGWELAPQVVNNVSLIGESVALLQRHFKEDAKPTEHDVMLIGLLGNHFNSNLEAFDKYAELLMTDVVTPFPGRVVILGSSPQHFKSKNGAYNTSVGQTKCVPAPLPSEVDDPTNKYRSDVWGYNVMRHMRNKRARFVDMYEFLHPLWLCHRNAMDCTHWQDSVISIQVQFVLEALHKIA